MTLATSMRNAARNLITTFGNTALVYTYSSATKVEDEEGDVTVSSWGTASEVKVVDGNNVVQSLQNVIQGIETIGDDEKTFRDDTTIAKNDRITVDSIDYRVVEIRPIRIVDTLIIQIVKVTRVTDATNW